MRTNLIKRYSKGVEREAGELPHCSYLKKKLHHKTEDEHGHPGSNKLKPTFNSTTKITTQINPRTKRSKTLGIKIGNPNKTNRKHEQGEQATIEPGMSACSSTEL